MPDLHAFFDRDVYVKLIACDLWEEAKEALGITHPYRLASASAKGCERPLKRRGIPPETLEAAIARAADLANEVPVVPDEWVVVTDLFNKMLQANIDHGEAELTMVVMACPHDNCLISGDKRFYHTFNENFPAEYSTVKPRMVTFEACLLACIGKFGFEAVSAKARPAMNCDQALKLAYGSDGQNGEAEFIAALESFGRIP